MRIAIAGLASSHPFTDARILGEQAELVVFDDDPARLARFTASHPSASVAISVEELLDMRPDGVVLTVPTPMAAAALTQVLKRDLPCFVNKPAAGSAAQLAAIDEAARIAPHRVLSTSVLRFAPAFASFSVEVPEVLAAHAVVRHDVGRWANGHNPWQDDPSVGGGMLVTMGVHGVELLLALFGTDVELVGAQASTLRHFRLASEDTAVLALRWASGVVASVTFLGATEVESYEVTVFTAGGTRSVLLEGGGPTPDVTLGYRGTLDAFLSMVDGAPSPVPWEHTRAVISTLVKAREIVSA